MLLLNNKSDKNKLDQLRVNNHQKYQYIYAYKRILFSKQPFIQNTVKCKYMYNLFTFTIYKDNARSLLPKRKQIVSILT